MHSGTKLVRQIDKWTKTGIKTRNTWISSQRFEFKPPSWLDTVLCEVVCVSWLLLKNKPAEQLPVNRSLYTIVHSPLCIEGQSFLLLDLFSFSLTVHQHLIKHHHSSMWTFRNPFLCPSPRSVKKSIKVLKSM